MCYFFLGDKFGEESSIIAIHHRVIMNGVKSILVKTSDVEENFEKIMGFLLDDHIIISPNSIGSLT